VTKISIIIPCYNEKNTVVKLINILNNLQINKQIVLVDDYSNDGTREIIEKDLSNKIDKIIFHKKNLGKGACIRTAKEFILGDIVIIQDADLEYDPNDYNKLIKPILDKKVNVVYGSRVLNKNATPNKSFISNFRIFGNYLLTKFSNLINNQNLTDAHTCYKVFTKELFDKIVLKENGFNFCPEITTKLAILDEKILEIPINYKGRSIEQGKKIRFWHALEAIYTLIKYKLLK
tara:strand:- start:21 stop:719 length:699 start_codon:yes stop_codon:yes gene_type:complete